MDKEEQVYAPVLAVRTAPTTSAANASCDPRADLPPSPKSTQKRTKKSRGEHKSRGMCGLCAEPVLVNQRRLKVKDGYVHEECAREQSKNGGVSKHAGQGNLGNPTQKSDKAHGGGGNEQECSTRCNYPGCSNSASGQCRRCKLVYYCCREHQLDDWKAHKEICASKPVSSLASLSEEHLQVHNGICDRTESECSSEPTIRTDVFATRHVCNYHDCENIAEGQCKQCKKVYYCCKEHQHQDWQAHKALCFAAPEYAEEKLREYRSQEEEWQTIPLSRTSSRRSSSTHSSCPSMATLTHCSVRSACSSVRSTRSNGSNHSASQRAMLTEEILAEALAEASATGDEPWNQ